MGEVSYKPIIDEFVWSYSRISAYKDCPYRFFLKYIKNKSEKEQFFSSYGSFIHKLIELFYRGVLTKEQMLFSFLEDYSTQVKGTRPKKAVVSKYIIDGVNYLKSFTPFPCDMVDIEHKVEFTIGDYPFVGYIDFIGQKNGDIYLIDNKSKSLKQRSNRKTPTVNDQNIDETLKQLYIYSAAIEQEFGKLPTYVCLNCFRTGEFIKEQFVQKEYEKAKQWVTDTISDISVTTEFPPNNEYFACKYICGVSDYCKYDTN